MTNNTPLLNALSQINTAYRNKQLFYLCGTIAVIGVIGFTIYYIKFQDQTKEIKYYREKLLKTNQQISMLQEFAAKIKTAKENKQSFESETKKATNETYT